MPTGEERAERLRAVLHVLYLIFNEGYTSSIGPDLHRADLSNEAIRLTRAVHDLLPNHGEIVAHFRAAAERTMNIPERNHLTIRAARLADEQRFLRTSAAD